MEKHILEFKKTTHFQYRQWDRGIEDSILRRILSYVRCADSPKSVVVVTPSFLQKRNLCKDVKNCLVIIIKKANVLITTYWCDKPELLQKKEKNIQILK